MNCDYAVMLSEVRGRKVITFEIGVGDNGEPVFRVAVFNGKRWNDVCYRDLREAYATYKFLKRVV